MSGSPGTTVPVRPLSFRELLDTPFALIQANIRVLLGGMLVGLVAGEVLVVAITGGVSHLNDGGDGATALGAIVSTVVVAWILRFWLRATTVTFGLAGVNGASIGWRGAAAGFVANAGPLLVFQLLFTLVGVLVLTVSSLLIVTIVPGTAWLGWLRSKRFLTVPVIVAESVGHTQAVARSTLLVAGTEWAITGLWLCHRLLLLVLCVPLIGIPWLLADLTGTHRWPVIVLLTGAVLLIAMFAEVIEASTRVVVYIDRRCRREGVDISVPGAAR
ncbi:hypothetical protein GCM10023318_12630 [Nocardia callitridis]|uniref:ABC transporter permease n=1 Tax=Nocardia callitridis TaxID=648753 RepID=A0ABP9K0T8_9NOCA